jgi:type IV pilus assembly protein PilX
MYQPTNHCSSAQVATNDARFLFLPECGNSGDSLGLCAEQLAEEVPNWLKVDFTDTSLTAKTVEFGKFTGRAFPVGAAGIQPYQKPRYIIELMSDAKNKEFTPYFRITAMGFGPRQDIQVVLQTVYRN